MPAHSLSLIFQKVEPKSYPLEHGLDPLLTNRMWQKWRCVSSKAWPEKTLHFSLSEMFCSRGSQWPCFEDTQALLSVEVAEAATSGEELRSPTNRQRQLAKWKRAALEVDLPAPAKPSGDRSPGWHLTATSWERSSAKAAEVENKTLSANYFTF